MGNQWNTLGLALALAFCTHAHASRTFTSSDKLGKEDAQLGAQTLSDKISQLFNQLDMKEATYTPDAPAGVIDRNSGNPSQSAKSSHSYTESVCLEWMNQIKCNKWLDPGVPYHGLDPSNGDYSREEGLVTSAWKNTQNIDGGGQYKFWEIRRVGDNGGSNLDSEGKLDLSGVTEWAVNDQLSQELKALGRETSARLMLSTYDKKSTLGAVNVMPTREALPAISKTLTKQMRNHLETRLKESWAASSPSEFLLSEDVPDCDAYRTAVQVAMATQPSYQQKLPYQARLKPGSMGSMESRYQACMAARQASVDAVNPMGGGDVESERIDQTLVRLNIAAIDRAGINVTELPKPSAVQLTAKQINSEFADFESGGMTVRGIKEETNAATLNSYNNNLETAAQRMKNIVMRNPAMVDNGDSIRAFKIEPGTRSAVEINGFTDEMKRDLAGTPIASAPIMQDERDSGQTLETKPLELSITRK